MAEQVFKAYDVFADTVTLKDGGKYTISLNGGVVELKSSDGKESYSSATNRNAVTNQTVSSSYFDAGRLFGQDDAFVKGLNAAESSGDFSDGEEETTTTTTSTTTTTTTTTTQTSQTSATSTQSTTEESTKSTTSSEDTTEDTTESVDETDEEGLETVFTNSTNPSRNTEITAKESRVIADLTIRETADGAVVTNANANEGNEQQTSAISEIPSPVIVNETPPANGGLLAALIFVAVVAAAAIGGCVYFFTKFRKESDLRKEAEESRHEAQEQYSKLKISYDIAQHGAKQQELLLQDSQTENERLKQEIRDSATVSANYNEEKLEEYREKAEGWYSEYQRVEAENQRLTEIQRQQEQRIHALEAAVASSVVAAMPFRQVKEEPKRYDEAVTRRVSQEIPEEVLICTNESQLELYDDVQFLNANVSVTGKVTLTESMGRRAPFVAIENLVYLNPYFFHDLADGEESYNNLVSIRDVFELEGLRGGSQRYGLESVVPAEVIRDESGTYHIENMGRLTLRTH